MSESRKKPMGTHEPEIVAAVDLCTANGRLNPAAVGWSRQPMHRCALPAGWPRRKRWEFWGVLTNTHLLRVTYGCTDYLGIVAINLLDYERGDRVGHLVPLPLARGMVFPDTVAGGDIHFSSKTIELSLRNSPEGTRIQASVTKPGAEIEVDVVIADPPGQESLTVVIPWSESKFQCTSKHNTRPATGRVRCNGIDYGFGAENDAFGILDFGRGVWPYRTAWNWAAAAGTQDGRRIGLNLGGKWTDRTGLTENGITLDGRLHKIGEDLEWHYDRSDFRRPWRIVAPRSGRVDLEFTPSIEEADFVPALVVRTELHWCLGRFRGTVVTDEGETVEVRDVLGWAEEHLARW